MWAVIARSGALGVLRDILANCVLLLNGLVATVSWLTNNPQVSDLIKYIFLGTILEFGKRLTEKLLDWLQRLFIIEATFVRGDFAYDWVTRYLADQKVWSTSRIFHVIVQNPINAHASAQLSKGQREKNDRKPRHMYQPSAGSQTPVFFKWKGHWISVNLGEIPWTQDDSGNGQTLRLRVWSRRREILDNLVEEARSHYLASSQPPRLLRTIPDKSETLITTRFRLGDRSYDWILAWIRAHDAFDDAFNLDLSTTRTGPTFHDTDTEDGTDRDALNYKPARGSTRRLFWHDHWFQFNINEDGEDMDQNQLGYGGQGKVRPVGVVDVTLHSSDRQIMTDLVKAAREEYGKHTLSRVRVHLPGNGWNKAWEISITRPRRSLETVALPAGVKEMLLDDVEDFLSSGDWYAEGGIPHRRGYLLYGEPGTGKSSTVHAVASELGLEIYYIQLASNGLEDDDLRRLFADVPAKCIILLEDIDCAFPARQVMSDDEVAEEDRPKGSDITFSGLLNCLDSVISEEGRVVFATTNYIERLDSALIRPGRMDVKIEFKLSTHKQLREVFERLFRCQTLDDFAKDNASMRRNRLALPIDSASLASLASQFADLIPEGKYSLAQIQGFLISKRKAPMRAVEEIEGWMRQQDEEKRVIEEKRNEARKAREKQRSAAAAIPAPAPLPPATGSSTFVCCRCQANVCKHETMSEVTADRPPPTPPQVNNKRLDETPPHTNSKVEDDI